MDAAVIDLFAAWGDAACIAGFINQHKAIN
jgi:hypothetical protein